MPVCSLAQYNSSMINTIADPTTDPVVTQSMLDKTLEENNKILTEQLTESISKKIIDEVSGIFSDFAERVDDRFNRVEDRLDKIEFRLEKIEADIRSLNERVDNLEEKYDHIIRTLDSFLKRLSEVEANDAARDAQLARFERWLHQLAEKVNVKLES